MQYLKSFQILKSLIGNGNGSTLIDSTDPNIKKIDSFLKLFYKLFLYSIIGVFAKLISKILKL